MNIHNPENLTPEQIASRPKGTRILNENENPRDEKFRNHLWIYSSATSRWKYGYFNPGYNWTYATDLPEENYIDLPADTEAGREIVKRLIALKDPLLEVSPKFTPKGCSIEWINSTSSKVPEHELEGLLISYNFRLAKSGHEADFVTKSNFPEIEGIEKLRSTDSRSASTEVLAPIPHPLPISDAGLSGTNLCTCGFDAEGWREIPKTSDEIVKIGDVFTWDESGYNDTVRGLDGSKASNAKDVTFRTRRPKPDCPACKPAHPKGSECDEGYGCECYKQSREPFSLESELIHMVQNGMSPHNKLVYVRDAISKLVERINSMEGK